MNIQSSIQAQAEEIQAVFNRQREFRWVTKTSNFEHRRRLLELLHTSLIHHEKDIVAALSADFNKPSFETISTEIFPVLSELKYTLRNLHSWMRPKKVGTPFVLFGTTSEIMSESRGCVLIISPWNYPFQLAMVPLIGALAAGNTVILKPSELTPQTSQLLANILSEIYAPELVQVIQGGVPTSEALLNLPFDHIFFTGSTEVGKIVMRAASQHLSSVTLELGGKSPCIVDSTAQISTTAEKIVWGKFLNSGQTCIAPDYILVDKKISPAFELALKAEITKQIPNGPLANIINSKNRARLVNLTENRDEPSTATELRLRERLVKNPDLQSSIMTQEIFGPILPIIEFENLEEAIRLIQSREKPLSLYLFSESKNNIEMVLKQTSSGGVCINDTIVHLINHHLPFGGVGQSGMGSYHGEYSFRCFSHEKAVLKRRFFHLGSRILYPPYENKLNFYLKKFLAR